MNICRRLLLFALLAGLLVLGVGVWLLWPRTAITRENAGKIQVGMTLAEVEAIFGESGAATPRGQARPGTTGPALPGYCWREWGSGSFLVFVWFDEHDRAVSYKDRHPSEEQRIRFAYFLHQIGLW